MTIGPYEIQVWRDTGRPRFRVWFWRAPPVTRFDRWLYGEDWRPTYRWIFKIMSWWTLFIARRSWP